MASLALMTMDHRQHHLESIRAGLALVVYPLQYAVNIPANVGNWASEALATRNRLLEENRQLRERELLQQVRLQKLFSLEAENTRLRELLNSSSKIKEHVLIGELMAVDQDPFQRRVLINKGKDDGVFEGQPLLDAYGVMGQVVQVNALTSSALLITDPNNAVPVQDNRTGLRAIAMGIGESDRLEIPNIPNNTDIEVGDLLVTSGLGGHFPTGYPVATIATIKKDPTQPFAHVIATPTAHLERSREVLLVWQQPAAVKEPAKR